MAEHQLPKLTVRVRFPSPAPHTEALVRTNVPPGLPWSWAVLKHGWAITGPLGHGDRPSHGRSTSVDPRSVRATADTSVGDGIEPAQSLIAGGRVLMLGYG